MQPKTSWDLQWLTDPTSGGLQFPRGWSDLARTRIPLPPGTGEGYIELFHLGQGMDICRGTVTFDPAMAGKLVPMAEAKGTVPEPMFGVHSARLGHVTVRERCARVELSYQGETTLFQHVDRLDFQPLVSASHEVEITVITMGVPILCTLLGEGPALALLRALGVEALPSAATRALPHAVNRILHETLPSGLSGQMRILFSQAKTLEYLCALSSLLSGAAAPDRSTAKLVRTVADLRAELLGLEGKVPSLNDLARKYGRSAKALNDAFRSQYGSSIYAFVSDHRLGEAHAALEHTDIPMKALAANLGYSHVNNFIAAFRKKFSYPPGQVRRGGGAVS